MTLGWEELDGGVVEWWGLECGSIKKLRISYVVFKIPMYGVVKAYSPLQ